MTPIDSLDPAVVVEIRREMSRPQHPADCWFCCGLIVRGTLVLVIPYYPDRNNMGRVQIKFPGGCGEGQGNTPERTLLAEMEQEVLAGGSVISWTPLHRQVIDCKKHPGGNHTKYAAQVEILGGVRTQDLLEGRHVTEDGEETNEMLGPPMFVPAEELVATSGEYSLFRSHRPFLLALARTRLKEDPAWWRIADDLVNVQGID